MTSGSSKKVWWKCSIAKHEWQATVHHRIYAGSGCPFCSHCSSREEVRILTELRKMSIFKNVECKKYSPIIKLKKI